MKKDTIIILSQADFNNKKISYTSYVHNHALSLQKEGYNVVVLASITIKPKNMLKKYVKEQIIDGVKVIYFKRLGFSNLLYNSKINLNAISYFLGSNKIIADLVKKENVILLDAHTFKIQGVAASKLKKIYNIPTFVTLHGTSFDRNLHFRNGINSIKKVANSIDYYICVSKKIEKQLDDLNIKNKKVIYNGVNFNKNLTYNKKKFSIITVGSFTYDKNIDVIINSFKKILNQIPNCHLTIIGDGVLKDKLYEIAYPIRDKITFTGFLPNNEVLEYLSISNVFILPSSPEGFGICYIEAMSNRCITIGTKGEGIDGFIKDGVNGFLVNINEEEIANLIIEIFNNKYDLEKIREAGKNDARKLTWKRNANEYIKLINEKTKVI